MNSENTAINTQSILYQISINSLNSTEKFSLTVNVHNSKKNVDKVAESESELGLYLDSSTTSALMNKTYAYLHDVAETVTNSDWFKNQLGDVNTCSHNNKINPIGSEIKPQKPVEAPKAVVEVVQAPVPVVVHQEEVK